jgi:heme-degrading monooxygenase HmoA
MHALLLTYDVPVVQAVAHDELCAELAPAFASVPGLVSQTWLANRALRRYGSFSVFESKAAFDAFVASELFAATSAWLALEDAVANDFAVVSGSTPITRGPGVRRAAA